MSEAERIYGPDCFTYQPAPCYICGSVTLPDDQEVILRGKRYVCVCLTCHTVLASIYRSAERYEQ